MSASADPSADLPTAVVFDCDGTLADTESLSDRAWEDALAEFGYRPTADDFAAIIGQPWHRCWEYFSARLDLGDEASFKATITRYFTARFSDELVIYDDAIDTMRSLADAGVGIAVASSSQRRQVAAVLERAAVAELVTGIVAQEDVARHKPDPEPYLVAAQLLGVAPGRCAAVEDTPVGVAAAVAAGLFTVGILRRATTREDLGAAHRVVDRITVPALLPAEGAARR